MRSKNEPDENAVLQKIPKEGILIDDRSNRPRYVLDSDKPNKKHKESLSGVFLEVNKMIPDIKDVEKFVRDLRDKKEAKCIDCGGTVKQVLIGGIPTFKCDSCGTVLIQN